MKKKKVILTVIIPAYNEERNLKRLFKSLENQKFPAGEIEFIVINDSSTDKTGYLSRKFGAKVIDVKTRNYEINKEIGVKAAKGNLVYWMDADMEVSGKDFFAILCRPLIDNPKIGASFTAEFSFKGFKSKVESSILRFISYHPLQHDPLFAYLSVPIESTYIEEKDGYFICKFVAGKVPVVGRIVYRKKELLATNIGITRKFIDMEAVEIYTRAGHDLYAYVPEAKLRHYHAETLSLLVKKRLRNLDGFYFPNYDTRYFRWFDPNSPRDVIRIGFWVLWVNLFIPELIRGIYYMIRRKDQAFLWQPIVALVTTDAIVWKFLSDKKGRKIAVQLLKTLIKNES